MAEQAYAYVTLIPVAKGFKSALTKELGGVNGVGKTAGDQTGKGFAGSFGKAMVGIGAVVAAAFSVRAIADFTKNAVLAAEGVQTANARIGSIATSMDLFGDATAAVTDRLVKYAEANELSVATDAESIKATQAKLLTFRNLAATADEAGGAFDRATMAAIDLAAAGFGEAEGNAVALGKALNDPILGVASLGRMGVQFTEEQKGMIKSLVETGDMASAQEMILKELESQVGGTAMATADASVQMGLAFDNIKETAGLALLPAFQTVNAAILPLIEYTLPKLEDFLNNKIAPFAQRAADAFANFTTNLTTGGISLTSILDNLINTVTNFITGGGLEQAFSTLSEYRTSIFNAVLEAAPGIVDAFVQFLPEVIDFFVNTMLPQLLDQLTNIIVELVNLFAELMPKIATTFLKAIPTLLMSAVSLFTQLVNAVIAITPVLISTIIELLPVLVDSILSMLPEILGAAVELFTAIVMALPKIIPPLVTAVIDLLPVILDTLIDMIPELIDGAFQLFTGIVSALYQATPQIIAAVAGLLPQMVSTIIGFIPKFFEAGFEIVKGLARGIIENGPRIVGDAIGSVVNGVIGTAKSLLGIRSPSRVFFGFGENIGQGLINGMEVMFNGVKATAAELAALAAAPTAQTLEALGISSSYSNYGVANLIPTTDGSLFDVGRVTDDLNAVYNYMGAQTAQQMTDIQESLFGGSFQQAIDALTGQATLFNAKTGMSTTIAASSPEALAAAVERAVAEGFKPTETIQKPIEDLRKAMEDLASTVDREGLKPAGVALAEGGYVDGPTRALIGEAGPEVVIPLDRFESMMGMTDDKGKTVNYYAAPNQSIDSEQALFQAMRRAKVVANW